MQLIIRRDQRKGLLRGTATFTLEARAQVSEEEMARIQKYRMGSTILYEKRYEIEREGSGFLGVISLWWIRSKEFSLNINDLVRGKRVDCKDIVEMLTMEDDIRQACDTFKRVLDAATHFGGEEIVKL